jgi:lysophospholipase L1-like esterase
MARVTTSMKLAGVLALAVTSGPAVAATRVACVGDSITAGIGTTGGNAYPAVLGRMLGGAYEVGNFGDSGSTAMKVPASTSYWTTPAFGNSKTFAPAVVVIMLGTNDSKTAIWKGGNNSYEADYRSLLATYAALPSKPRLYVSLPPPALTTNFTISGPVIMNQILPILRRVAADTGATIIDVNGAFQPDPRKYFGPGSGTDIGDGIHPNNAGAEAIARAVWRQLIEPAPDAGVADARPLEDAASVADISVDLAPIPDTRATEPDTLAPASDAAAPPPDVSLKPDLRGSGGVGGASGDEPDAAEEHPPRAATGKSGGCALGGDPTCGPWLSLLLAGMLRARRRRLDHRSQISPTWKRSSPVAKVGPR